MTVPVGGSLVGVPSVDERSSGVLQSERISVILEHLADISGARSVSEKAEQQPLEEV